jgi:hypothetical protein
VCLRWVPEGEQSGLLMHTATMENDSLCVRNERLTPFLSNRRIREMALRSPVKALALSCWER